MDGWKIAQTLNIDEHSALIAVGGDGTLHEVVNGMMFRTDKKKVPIALVPNGSGNDTCISVGLKSIDQAIEYIKKGDLLKCDLNRVYLDVDTFDEIEKREVPDEQKYAKARYSLINSGIGFTAKCCSAAAGVKSWAGSQCYTIASFKLFFSGIQPDSYRMSVYNKIDGVDKLTYSKDITSMLFAVHNGRFTGGGMPLTPGCVMNDGLLDVAYYNQVV